MLRWTVAAVLATVASAPLARSARAHCQVPCGIYRDHARVKMIREDITTIAKAARQVRALAKKRDAQSANQLTRWVITKEQHAEKIIRTVSDYFMAQKIKPPKSKKEAPRYLEQLHRHHLVMVAAMKCKQSAGDEAVTALKKAVDAIAGYWPAK
jgi:nickel superoxide dismutase